MSGARLLLLAGLLSTGNALAIPTAAPAATARSRTVMRGQLNLNDADQAALEQLPGIGETKALRIIEYRRNHPFRRIEELTKVKGIGRKTVARLKPYLAIAGPTTLHAEQ